MSKAHVVTVSDGAFHGRREDRSGPALVNLLSGGGFEVGQPQVVPDDVERITEAVMTAVARGVDLVVSTGGTGLGPRDVTPQALSAVIDYEVPGIGEAMRRAGVGSTPMAALSRSMAGVRDRTLIISVPGSPKGAVESLEAVMPVVGHAIQLLHGDTKHS
ncbi:MAG TPA: MogA/MoaB family molybdenum cofactor biosynthesis protein [Candidatus Dormibacteraeota bacterium]|nr:MogA/MoaB family molybdenum cofactor biosynthesis protein [Candidatus Dormibacteraeota bacterium]